MPMSSLRRKLRAESASRLRTMGVGVSLTLPFPRETARLKEGDPHHARHDGGRAPHAVRLGAAEA